MLQSSFWYHIKYLLQLSSLSDEALVGCNIQKSLQHAHSLQAVRYGHQGALRITGSTYIACKKTAINQMPLVEAMVGGMLNECRDFG
jgi:hypothetical protein